jgi:hypothetical protein
MVDVAKKVIVITGDTTQAISAIKDIQTASERVARAVGGNFGTVAKNLGTIFQKVDTKYLTDAQGNIKGVASASETLQSQVINTNGAVGTLTENLQSYQMEHKHLARHLNKFLKQEKCLAQLCFDYLNEH